jgi:hypothetical protein
MGGVFKMAYVLDILNSAKETARQIVFAKHKTLIGHEEEINTEFLEELGKYTESPYVALGIARIVGSESYRGA